MKYLFTSLLLITHGLVFSQQPASKASVNCVVHWKKGEEKVFTFIHTRKSNKEGNNEPFMIDYEAQISVLDADTSGYTIQWVLRLSDSFKKANPGVAQFIPMIEGMRMLYKASATGEFTQLINWKEVLDRYVLSMEIALPKNIDSTAKAGVEKTKAMFNSREMVEATMIKEIQLFHSVYGVSFNTKETKENVELPNPLGGDPLPAIQIAVITELNPKQDYFKLATQQTIDSAGAQGVFEGFFKKMGMGSDSTLVTQVKQLLSSLEVKDQREYSITLSSGWPKRIEHTRTVRTEQIEQTETYIVAIKE